MLLTVFIAFLAVLGYLLDYFLDKQKHKNLRKWIAILGILLSLAIIFINFFYQKRQIGKWEAKFESAQKGIDEIKEQNKRLLSQNDSLQQTQYDRDKEAREAQMYLSEELSSAQEKIQMFQELSTPIRKLIFRFIYKREPQLLTTDIDVWKKTSDFHVFRYRIRIAPGEYGSLRAYQLETHGDASFTFGVAGGSVPVAGEDKVLQKLPTQYRSTPSIAFLETRIAVSENLTVSDLLGASVYFSFRRQDRPNIATEVLNEIKRIQIYAQVTDEKVAICTYDICDDQNLFATAKNQKTETTIETDGYHLWVSPPHEAPDLSGGLGVRLNRNAFKILNTSVVLDVLPEFLR